MRTVAVADLRPGDLFDVPEDAVQATDNEVIQQYEYARVECVNGGWADAAAAPGQVVVYTENFAVPIVLDATREVSVEGSAR